MKKKKIRLAQPNDLKIAFQERNHLTHARGALPLKLFSTEKLFFLKKRANCILFSLKRPKYFIHSINLKIKLITISFVP